MEKRLTCYCGVGSGAIGIGFPTRSATIASLPIDEGKKATSQEQQGIDQYAQVRDYSSINLAI